jgi:hypothetical protein
MSRLLRSEPLAARGGAIWSKKPGRHGVLPDSWWPGTARDDSRNDRENPPGVRLSTTVRHWRGPGGPYKRES